MNFLKKLISILIIFGIIYFGVTWYLKPDKIKDVESTINPEVLVNYNHQIPSDENINLIDYKGYRIADIAYNDLVDMDEAAQKDGVILQINNSYRSTDEQKQMFNDKLISYQNEGYSYEEAYSQTKLTVQEPGYSEHQTGLAIDFSESGNQIHNDQMWDWLKQNAYKYGFILRYPEDKYDITKITYEPWHYRYVGKEVAKYITQNNLTLEEYVGGN